MKEVDIMPEREYVCLVCGHFYRVVPEGTSDGADKMCPKCNAMNVAKVSPSRLFDFFNGGG